MNRRSIANSLVVALLLASIGGCSTMKSIGSSISGLFSGNDGGPDQVNELVGAIEQVYVDSELGKEKVHAAVASLQAIVSADFQGDALTAYAQLEGVVEESEKQAETLRDSVENMKDTADPLFEQWAEDLKTIANVKMRQRSRNRMMATRERYDAIVAAVEPTLAAYDAVNLNLRDHLVFLGNDFNPASVAMIQEDVHALSMEVSDLDAAIDECLITARAYVDSAALPGAAAQDVEGEEPRPVKVSGSSDAPESADPVIDAGARGQG